MFCLPVYLCDQLFPSTPANLGQSNDSSMSRTVQWMTPACPEQSSEWLQHVQDSTMNDYSMSRTVQWMTTACSGQYNEWLQHVQDSTINDYSMFRTVPWMTTACSGQYNKWLQQVQYNPVNDSTDCWKKQDSWSLEDWITHVTKVDLVDATGAELHPVSGRVFTEQHAVHGVTLCLHIKRHRQHASLDLAHQVKVHLLLRLGRKVQVDRKPGVEKEKNCHDLGWILFLDAVCSTMTK